MNVTATARITQMRTGSSFQLRRRARGVSARGTLFSSGGGTSSSACSVKCSSVVSLIADSTQMTNAQAPMTNKAPMTNDQRTPSDLWSLGLGHLLVIGAWALGLQPL